MLFIHVLCSLIAACAYSQTITFDAREATIATVHSAIFSRTNTCRDIVSAFLSRIEALNNHVNAIITLNPRALHRADELDFEFARGNATGSLFCVPVLLKDNYDTLDMPTTGGCLALRDSQPTRDAPLVEALKRAGSVILGKTNLHEMALEGLSVSSLGGQTINPYDPTRTPGGSSGGSAAAVAMSFAVWATGSDTVNSLRNPCSANSLFSVRPTRGLITRAGIIPVSSTQDTAGPIARSVEDLAQALTVMSSIGHDPADEATISAPSPALDFSRNLASSSLKGLRFGVLEGFFNRTETSETGAVNIAMDSAVDILLKAGAHVVSIQDPVYNANAILAKLDTQRYEYAEELDQYLKRSSLGGNHPDSAHSLYHGQHYMVIPAQYEYIHTALVSSTKNITYEEVKRGIRDLTSTLHTSFTSNSLDAILYPQQKSLVVKIGSPSQSQRNGILAALTGSPVVTVPIGFSPPTLEAPRGVPIGMEILGRPWSEEKLLQIAYQIDQLMHIRKPPAVAEEIVESKLFHRVPHIEPDVSSISVQYPIGTRRVFDLG